jgi:hypothetical protein
MPVRRAFARFTGITVPGEFDFGVSSDMASTWMPVVFHPGQGSVPPKWLDQVLSLV